MSTRFKFHVSGSKLRFKASCSTRSEGSEDGTRSRKTKSEKRRIRKRFEKEREDGS